MKWFSPSQKKDQNKLGKIIRSAKKIGLNTNSLNFIYGKACMEMVNRVMNDDCHPLHVRFNFLRSGKRCLEYSAKLLLFEAVFLES